MNVTRLTPSQILWAFLLPGVVIVTGATALWWITDGAYSWGEFLYFSLITVTTVGFGELPSLAAYPGAHAVVSMLVITGVTTIALFQSILTAVIVQRVVVSAFWRRRMQKKINNLSGHLIIAGAGRTGEVVIEESIARGQSVVAIDLNGERLEAIHRGLGGKLLYVVGDATHDATLHEAGVERAGGLITAMSDERDNLFVTVSFRALNKSARIVSKAVEIENEIKLRHAGANAVVSPHRIGGHRLVGEYNHPTVNEFLDRVLNGAATLRFEEVALTPESTSIGKRLGDMAIHEETDAFVVALRTEQGDFINNPSDAHCLEAGQVLIVLGEPDCRRKLRQLLGLG